MKSSKKRAQSKKELLIKQVLSRGTVDVIERTHLERALSGNKKLRVKLGIDPTSPDLHIGTAVVLRKLKQFQDLGHKVVLIIGDFTAQIGDPSDQKTERRAISKKEIVSNMKNYLSQAGKVIDLGKTEVRYNSEWLNVGAEELLALTKVATINQVSERADFRARIKRGERVSLMEAFYSLLQGYDSVKIKADVEIGGTDQLLNLLMGRQVQQNFGMKKQDILTVPLLEGTDGVRKMSKSYNNYIGINAAPKDMFGKVMSIKDALIPVYFTLCTDVPEKEILKMERDMKSGRLNPRDAKIRLAREIVLLYHGERKAASAENEFVNVFTKKKLPKKVSIKLVDKRKLGIVGLLVASGTAKSNSEARRLIEQGGVRVDDMRIIDPKKDIKILPQGVLLQVGRRKFVKVKYKK